MLNTSFWMIFFALTGSAVGSFLNVCIDRLPLHQSIITPPSRCPVCERKVAALDMVPVFNYLWLKGKCRYCHSPIPLRIPIVELLTGVLFALLYWKYELHPELAMPLIYAGFLIIIIFIDLEHRLILNKVIYPGILVAFIFSFFWPDLGVINSLIGGATGFALMFLIFIVSRGGMGEGDVKLALMMGLMGGFPEIFIALLIALLTGGLMAILLLSLHLKKRKEAIPFGPFLAVAGMVTLLWGESLYDWYRGLFI